MLRAFLLPGFEIKLSEDGKPQEWHQLLKTGSFKDKRYGGFRIDRKYLSDLKTNFDKKVRRIDLAVDYKHESDKEAAGWIEDVKLEEDKLFIKVNWTPAGEKKLAEKEFRYLSADLSDNYEDNETGNKHGPTLLGAGLTNRPVIKGMQPVVQLSEGDDEMDLKEAQEKIDALEKQLSEAKQSTEVKDLQKKLSETEAQIKKFQDEKEQAEKDKKLAEKKAEFQKLLSEKKVCPAQEKAFLDGDMVEFMKNAQALPATTAAGSGKEGGGGEDVDTQIKKLAEQKMIDHKGMTFSEAIGKVREEKPELWKQRYA